MKIPAILAAAFAPVEFAARTPVQDRMVRLAALGIDHETIDAALDLAVAGASAQEIRFITAAWTRGAIRTEETR